MPCTGRVILWFVMRARSTAFTRAVGQIPNIGVIFEPYYTACAYGPERSLLGFTDFVPEETAITYAYVRALLERRAQGTQPIFVKDCTSGIPQGHFSDLPCGYSHAFLIRDPVEVCHSLHQALAESPVKAAIFDRNDLDRLTGFAQMHLLHQHLLKTQSEAPLVLCSEELSRQPADTLRRFCEFASLPYSDRLLTWPTRARFPEEWWVSKSDQSLNSGTPTYENALRSGGFKPQRKIKKLTADLLPMRYRDAIAEMQIHYEALRAFTIDGVEACDYE